MEAKSYDFQNTYYLPDFQSEFGGVDIFSAPLQKPVVVNAAPVFATPTIQSVMAAAPVLAAVPVVAKKTIAFTVYAGKETLPGANIAIDGVDTAITNGNGYAIITNVPITAIVKISYIGFEHYIIGASSVPAKVLMKSGIEQLPDLVITAKKKATTSTTWIWWLAGAVGALGIYKYSKIGTTIVKAKI